MRDYGKVLLPPGYKLDMIGDPCVIALCRADGTVVAYCTYATDLQEIKRVAEEDRGKQG